MSAVTHEGMLRFTRHYKHTV